jgi:hypothetical protein
VRSAEAILLGCKTGGVAAARAFNSSGAVKLIEVFFGPGRRAVPPPRWPDVLQLAEAPGVRKLPEAALAAPRLAEGRDVRKPPEVAPAAELLPEERSGATVVSQRRQVAG